MYINILVENIPLKHNSLKKTAWFTDQHKGFYPVALKKKKK
jgi:hypothetical protein